MNLIAILIGFTVVTLTMAIYGYNLVKKDIDRGIPYLIFGSGLFFIIVVVGWGIIGMEAVQTNKETTISALVINPSNDKVFLMVEDKIVIESDKYRIVTDMIDKTNSEIKKIVGYNMYGNPCKTNWEFCD